MQESENNIQDSLRVLQTSMNQLSERVTKIDEEMTDLEMLNGKLSDLKTMMKDIWKHQRRKAKKQHSLTERSPPSKESGEQGEKMSATLDETKTDDDYEGGADESIEETALRTPEGGDDQTTVKTPTTPGDHDK